jgi:hypothetical protein
MNLLIRSKLAQILSRVTSPEYSDDQRQPQFRIPRKVVKGGIVYDTDPRIDNHR